MYWRTKRVLSRRARTPVLRTEVRTFFHPLVIDDIPDQPEKPKSSPK
jgi:hypothetical protein